MIISIKDPLILKDLTQIVYSSGSHRFLSPKISWKYIKESDMARALKLWYRGGLGSIWFSHLHRLRILPVPPFLLLMIEMATFYICKADAQEANQEALLKHPGLEALIPLVEDLRAATTSSLKY